MGDNATVQGLRQVLASSTVFYQKLRYFHWVVKGKSFFALHEKFEELYDRWNEFIDEVAERIVQLGGEPVMTLAQAVKESSVSEATGYIPGAKMVQQVVTDLKAQSDKLVAVRATADEAGDTTTANLIDPAVDQIAKDVWMFEAFLAD